MCRRRGHLEVQQQFRTLFTVRSGARSLLCTSATWTCRRWSAGRRPAIGCRQHGRILLSRGAKRWWRVGNGGCAGNKRKVWTLGGVVAAPEVWEEACLEGRRGSRHVVVVPRSAISNGRGLRSAVIGVVSSRSPPCRGGRRGRQVCGRLEPRSLARAHTVRRSGIYVIREQRCRERGGLQCSVIGHHV